jgi:hypothetical protein
MATAQEISNTRFSAEALERNSNAKREKRYGPGYKRSMILQSSYSLPMERSLGLASPDSHTAIVSYVKYPHTASRVSEKSRDHNSCRDSLGRETSITIPHGLLKSQDGPSSDFGPRWLIFFI